MFSLLDALAAHQDPVSLKEISERTGCTRPPPTAS
jgi:DNA-binding IclR family transcriptional regulator